MLPRVNAGLLLAEIDVAAAADGWQVGLTAQSPKCHPWLASGCHFSLVVEVHWRLLEGDA